jgi:hypothetical protein
VGLSYAEANDRKPPGGTTKVEGNTFGVALSGGAGIEYFVASNIAVGVETRYVASRGHTLKIGTREEDGNLGAVLLAFTLAAVQPVDATTLGPSFLYGLGDPQGYRAIGAALALLAVASFLAAALIRRSPRFALAGAGAALLLAGRALAGYGACPAAVVGVLALAAGTWLFVRQIAVYYLWV